MVAAYLLFAFTYAGMALGRIPGLALDRTGFAILGAVGFLATGMVSLEEAKEAVDVPTLAVLFGMMLLSAQYEVSGLYAAMARRLARTRRPRRLLAGTIVVSAALAAVLTNDVVCLALTPLLVRSLRATSLPVVPYLIALACATNIGSALTPIGNPQNILVAQAMDLPFAPFVATCAGPVLVSLVFLHVWLARRIPSAAAPGDVPADPAAHVPLHPVAAAKAVLLTGVAIVLFLVPAVPAPLTALLVGGVVLTSRRMRTREALVRIDWHLLALFAGLFVVMAGFAKAGGTDALRDGLAGAGIDATSPLALVAVATVASLLVGNVPAVMLLLTLVPRDPGAGHALALASTLSGNAILPGSIANLIVAEQAAKEGVHLGFAAHARAALPVTIVSLAVAAAFLLALDHAARW